MIAWLLVPALAGVVFEPEPRLNEATEVRVTDAEGRARAGLTLRVVHRPGLPEERELGAGITDARGRARWKPEAGGTSALYAGDELLTVTSVRGQTSLLSVLVPWAVIACLALAGLIWDRRRP